MNDTLIQLSIFAAFIVAVLLAISAIMSRLYQRSNRETALVRTGLGGKKIIIDGGCLILPLFHDFKFVNMNTLRLEVQRSSEGALITADRMRVDVGVEFYVRVAASLEGVGTAAQTLGDRTWKVDELREMIEGKLIDGLRAVAARMTMDTLHENRADFAQQVHDVVSEDLTKNGLELESVALTALDQTPFSALDDNNAFNAVGMRQLAEVIAENKKRRAAIEADAEVIVATRRMEAEKRKYEIDRERQQTEIAEALEIERMKAQQEAQIAEERSNSERAAQESVILKERSIRAAEIAKQKAIQEAEILADRAIELTNQEKAIAIAEKSEEESQARAKADEAQALATRAAELVSTERDVTIAERQRSIEVLRARQDAESQAVRIQTLAQAEREAAEDRAAAIREEAQAEADSISIRAEAKKLDLLAEAEGREAINDAENKLSQEVINLRLGLAKIDQLPTVLEAMVKPIEKIDGIRIHQISGLGGGGNGGAASTGMGNGGDANGKPLVNQAIDGIMGMQLQMPAVQKLAKELGMSLDGGLEGVTESLLNNTALSSNTIEPDVGQNPTAN